MMRLVTLLMTLTLSGGVLAAGTAVPLQHADTNLSDREALYRGAQLFSNYCLGCHSAEYMRYSRIQQDLRLTDEQLQSIMVTTDKPGDVMLTTLDPNLARQWFGIVPPDLSLTARSRGEDWVYTYMNSFYAQPARPFGVNNKVFREVAMPHVLWPLQGIYDEHGEQVVAGALSPDAFDVALNELVSFMVYVAEPAKMQRYALGIKVIAFLLVMLVIFYLLKSNYWRDIKAPPTSDSNTPPQ